MRCLVTGASGQLGSHFVRYLLNNEAVVHCLVRQGSDLWRLSDISDRVAFIKADYSRLSTVAEAIRRADPEVAFHIGWQGVAGKHREDAEQITVNVKGSIELFQALPDTCRCFVGIGSQAEYGHYNERLSEDTPPKAVTAYGISKLCVGLMIEKLSALKNMRFVWLRLLATYGPMDDDGHLIPSVIRQLLTGKRPALTNGHQKWDYLYIKDAVEAIYCAAAEEKVKGVYNLCSGKAATVRYIVELIRDLINPGLDLGFGDISCRDNGITNLEADCTKLQEETCWQPKTSLEEGIKQTVAWYKEHVGAPREA